LTVYGHDHRGHGSSLAEGDVPGHLGHDGWLSLVDDVGLLVHRTKALHPEIPVVLIAHGMGSFAAQQFLLDRGDCVDAVALSGTAALDQLEPALESDGDLKLTAFNAAVLAPRTDFDWLSRDPAAVNAYRADPLCGFGLDVASLKDMFVGAGRLEDPRQMARVPQDLPLYIAAGSRDPVNGALTWL
jgi:alpha-beta hydrolase superfamily lysophospholipase